MNNLDSNLESLFSKMENFVTTKTVVGEPIHIGDVILLPLVDVSVGVGAGVSEKSKDDTSSGGGGGLAAKITPSAVLVVNAGKVQLVNVKNQDSVNKLLDMVPDVLSKFNFNFDKKNEKNMDIDDLKSTIDNAK